MTKLNTRKDKWGAHPIKRMYLCQWQLPQGTSQQWCKEEELIHPDNILLEHNTLRIAQYHHTQIKQQTIQTYTKFLNYKQTKDTKYVHPPQKITNLTLSIQECNPDKNIQTTKPTIQIQTSEANIYDSTGHYMATLTTERLQ